jgi:hypothetical protein
VAITYTWEFDSQSVKTSTIGGNSSVITSIEWRLKAVDTINGVDKSSHTSGTVELDTSDLSGFIAFSDLTQSDVEGMVESALGEDAITHYKTLLSESIDGLSEEQINAFVYKPYVSTQAETLPFINP